MNAKSLSFAAQVAMSAMLFIAASGCTMYTVEKTTPDQGTTVVKIKSTRSFEAPDLHYARQGGDAELDFKAASVDNNTEAFMAMFGGLIQMLSTMMDTMMSKLNTIPSP